MKTNLANSHRARSSEGGSAVLVILILLSIMLILSQTNTLTLRRLKLEIRTVEKHQIQRLSAPTNQPPAK